MLKILGELWAKSEAKQSQTETANPYQIDFKVTMDICARFFGAMSNLLGKVVENLAEELLDPEEHKKRKAKFKETMNMINGVASDTQVYAFGGSGDKILVPAEFVEYATDVDSGVIDHIENNHRRSQYGQDKKKEQFLPHVNYFGISQRNARKIWLK